jgi:hypothetical protein
VKQKLVSVLIFIILLATSSGTVSAQEGKPPRAEINAASEGSYWLRPGDVYEQVTINKEGFITPPSTNLTTPPEGILSSTLTTTPVMNGNFELGRFNGWSESSTHGNQVVVPFTPDPLIPPHSGNWIAWLGEDDNEVTTLSQNNISITSPTTLRLWYWTGSEDDCGWDFGYLRVNNDILYIWDLCYYSNTYSWVPLDIDLNAYNGQTVSISVQVTTDISYPSGMLIDDISLYGTFADVPYGYWSWSFIQGLSNAGVTSGCNNTTPSLYCPATTVTRDQMAVFLLRGKHTSSYSPPAPTGVFSDVPTNYWAAAWIEQLAVEGITSGCGGGSYCPTNPVTRDQMAVFLLKAKHGMGYTPPPATGVFQDVPTNHWAAAWIEQLAVEGITGGCSTSPLLYCPGQPVTRDQMAVFLVRTFGLATP